MLLDQAKDLLCELPAMPEQKLLRLMARQGPAPVPWLDLCRFAAQGGNAEDWRHLTQAPSRLEPLYANYDWYEQPSLLQVRAAQQILTAWGAVVPLPGPPGGPDDAAVSIREAWLRAAATAPDPEPGRQRWLPPERDALRHACELPVLVVSHRQEGLLARLMLTRVHAPGAHLRLVPAPASCVTPLTPSFAQALCDVTDFLRGLLKGTNDVPVHDVALAWDLATVPGVRTDLQTMVSLSGDSAGATFALGALWLLRGAAPLDWAGSLGRITREALISTYLTAALLPNGALSPVGLVQHKARALAPLLEARRRGDVTLPLHVCRDQDTAPEVLVAHPVQLEGHATLLALVQALANRCDPLTPAQQALHQALLAPVDPECPPVVAQSVLQQVLLDPCTTLRHYALRCWAEWESAAGGATQAHFVPLTVAADGSGPMRGGVDRAPFGNLQDLLAAHDLAGQEAYVVQGPPGAGKSTLLHHHLQHCCRQALQAWARNEVPAELPLYVELAAVPRQCAASGDAADEAQALRDWLLQRLQNQHRLPGPLLRLLGDGRRQVADPPLRLLLDGLNELQVPSGQLRHQRAGIVVRAVRDLRPQDLPLLLSVRQQHFDALPGVLLLRVLVEPWQPDHIQMYLRRRIKQPPDAWQPRWAALQASPQALELCRTPMHLAHQCELWLEGCEQPLQDRAALDDAWLWLRLRRELGLGRQRRAPNPLLEDTRLLSAGAQELLAAVPWPDPVSAAPRRPHTLGGALMESLLRQAEAQYRSDADNAKPGAERCEVGVPWDAVAPWLQAAGEDPDDPGALRQRWRHAVAALGLVTSPVGDSFRFSHQSWGEYLASCRLLARTPQQMLADVPDEMDRLLRGIQRPRPARPDARDEWKHQRQQVVARWKAAVPDGFKPGGFWTALWRSGQSLSLDDLRQELLAAGWNEASVRDLMGRLTLPEARVITPDTAQPGQHRVDLKRYGDAFGVQGALQLEDGPWHGHPLGVQALLGQWLPLPLRSRVWARLEGHIGREAANALRQAPGGLSLPPWGDMHEVLGLALQGLADPLPWLTHLMTGGNALACAGAAASVRHRLERKGPGALPHNTRPELQHLRRWLLLRSVDGGAGVKERLRAGGVLQALDTPIPGLPQPLQAQWEQAYGADGRRAFKGHGVDLRERLLAGERLGELGDTLRYEICSVEVSCPDRRRGLRHGVRLRATHWLDVGAPGQSTRHVIGDRQGSADERHEWPADLPHFQVAAYPVTVAEYRCFIDAGGYGPDQPWWGPDGGAAGTWLARSGRARPLGWGEAELSNPLQPVVGLTWWEAMAYARWAAPLYGGRRDGLRLSLPTEVQWEAAARSAPRPGQGRPRWPHGALGALGGALDFNHVATRWGRPSPVGVFSHGLSGLGAADLAGNALEWCSNLFRPSYESEEDRAAARTPAPADNGTAPRALRGGGFGSSAVNARAGFRPHSLPDLGYDVVGLRLVRA